MKHVPRTKPKQASDTLRSLQRIAKGEAHSKGPAPVDELEPRTKQMSAEIDDLALRTINEASLIAQRHGFNVIDVMNEVRRRTLP